MSRFLNNIQFKRIFLMMKTTPIKVLVEQINYYNTFKQILIEKYKNGEITELKKDSVICDTDKQILIFEDAVKKINEHGY